VRTEGGGGRSAWVEEGGSGGGAGLGAIGDGSGASGQCIEATMDERRVGKCNGLQTRPDR
jgi:hypothetical protein